MRLFLPFFSLLLLLTLCESCKNEVKKIETPADVPAMVVTNTPEGVLRAYQELIDNNRFDEAKRLSTLSGQKFLEQLRILSTADTGDQPLETEKTVFNKINCRQSPNKAVCTYEIITDGENIPDSIALVYQNDKWLVDIPEENYLMDVDSLELMMKEMDTKKKK
jgi:hypothetical protein